MKIEWNKKYTTIAVYVLIVITALLLIWQTLQNVAVITGWARRIAGYIQPIINGCVFAFLVNPLLRTLDDKALPRVFPKMGSRPRRAVALLLTYLLVMLAVALFIAIVLPQIIDSVANIGRNIPNYFVGINNFSNAVLDYFTDNTRDTFAEPLINEVITRLRESLGDVFVMMYEYAAQVLPALISATTQVTTGVINLLLGLIVAIYLLLDREKLFAQFKKLFQALIPRKGFDLLYDIAMESNRVFNGFVVGKVIDSLIIGALCFIGMSVLSLPYPMLISVIVGVTNIIPYFGPIIGAIPSIIIICVVNPMQALWFGIFVLLLQQFDGNILGPKILGDSIGLSALWVIFSIMLFSGLFGVLGMFIGVPLFAVIYSMSRRFVAFLLARKGQSTDTRDYDSEKNPLIK